MESDSQRGDRNLNIQGDVDKSIVIIGDGNTVRQTVYHVSVFSSISIERSVSSPSRKLSEQEALTRQALINRVEFFWLNGVLRKSLYARTLELEIRERNDAIVSPIRNIGECVDTNSQTSHNSVGVAEVFDHLGTGRTLLILGKPGSGKTITLLKLTESLLNKAKNDSSQLIPIVINLSSWGAAKQPIERWLIQELNTVFDISKTVGKKLIDKEQLLFCLDGLDEVATQHRSECVQALNEFLQTHSQTEIIVCSRVEEYEALSEKLRVRSAVCVQPLTLEQIDLYIEKDGESLLQLREMVHRDTEIRELMSSPFILNVASFVYRSDSLYRDSNTIDVQSFRQQLFDRYIDSVLEGSREVSYTRRLPNQRQLYSMRRARYFMSYLARQMIRSSQTIFYIEDIQPSWLQSKLFKLQYFALFSAMVASFIVLLLTILHICIGYMANLQSIILSALFFGLPISLFAIGTAFSDIETVETLNLSWNTVKKALHQTSSTFMFLLVVSPIFGARTIIENVLEADTAVDVFYISIRMLFSLLGFCFSFSFVIFLIGVIVSIRGSAVANKTMPNQGIWKTILSTVIATFTAGCILTALTRVNQGADLIAILGPLFVLLIALVSGSVSSIKHLSLRIMLCLLGDAPWNYAQFLDYSTERLLLQKVGNGYIFVHRMLLEHIAQEKSANRYK